MERYLEVLTKEAAFKPFCDTRTWCEDLGDLDEERKGEPGYVYLDSLYIADIQHNGKPSWYLILYSYEWIVDKDDPQGLLELEARLFHFACGSGPIDRLVSEGEAKRLGKLADDLYENREQLALDAKRSAAATTVAPDIETKTTNPRRMPRL